MPRFAAVLLFAREVFLARERLEVVDRATLFAARDASFAVRRARGAAAPAVGSPGTELEFAL